jgi:hypothetical protein
MDINNLTLGQAKELACLFNNGGVSAQNNECEMVNTYSIIRTYSAGVWFGKVLKKSGNEIILGEARRLYYWQTVNKGVSLSEVSIHGLTDNSKVCEAVEKVWLQPIEIIPCTTTAIKNIQEKKNYVAS